MKKLPKKFIYEDDDEITIRNPDGSIVKSKKKKKSNDEQLIENIVNRIS
jgi:hypothetical protein